MAMLPPGAMSLVPAPLQASLTTHSRTRMNPDGGVGSTIQFAEPVTDIPIAPGVPPFVGIATVTLFKLLVFGAAALLTVKVYVVAVPFDAAIGLMLAVYATITVIAGLVLDVFVPSV